MDRVRLGIVGVGNIAPLNVAGYLSHPACDVVALCDPRTDVARAAATAWGVDTVHARLADLLADDRVDAVEVLTPTHLHREHVLAALAAGKHVSCQKPIAGSVADAREMVAAARRAGRVLRVSECYMHYPPLELARRLVADGAIGPPTLLRIRTVVATTDSAFQRGLQPEGYAWRFDGRSPGGHLFDDMVHKYAMANWLAGQPVTSVQAVVREGALFMEAPTAAIFEYRDPGLLGVMEVSHAPGMHLRSRYYGADEFFEIQGRDGWIWVTRCTGEMLDLAPVVLYRADGSTEEIRDVDADWGRGFERSASHFVDALLEDRPDPDMTGDDAIAALQLCFAVYEASNRRAPVSPASIEGSVSPPWWPPGPDKLRRDVEAARAASRRR